MRKALHACISFVIQGHLRSLSMYLKGFAFLCCQGQVQTSTRCLVCGICKCLVSHYCLSSEYLERRVSGPNQCILRFGYQLKLDLSSLLSYLLVAEKWPDLGVNCNDQRSGDGRLELVCSDYRWIEAARIHTGEKCC